jgi:hypothetical protein
MTPYSNFHVLTLGLGVNPRVRIWDLRALGQLETIINEVSDPKLVENGSPLEFLFFDPRGPMSVLS